MPKTRHRREDREQFWRDTIAAWNTSGQSVRAFCAARGVAEATFFARRRELAGGERLAATGSTGPAPVLRRRPRDPRARRRGRAARRGGRPRPDRCGPGGRRPAGRRAAGLAVLTLGLTGRIWVCLQPQDGRKSFDGLAAVVTAHLGRDPLSGDLFVFREQARGPAEDPGLAGGRVRPVPPPAGEGHVRLPGGGRRRGGRHPDRAGDDPRRARTRVGQAAAAVRSPGRRVTRPGFCRERGTDPPGRS